MKHAVGVPRSDLGATIPRGEDAVREQRTAVRTMFDRVSRRYDLLNRLLSFGLDGWWRRRAVEEMSLGGGDGALDVACGTGDLALEVARAAPGGRVVGIDFASRMLEIGKKKVSRENRSQSIRFIGGGAEALPFRAGSFAAAGIAFGIRNVPQRVEALREMARTVRPGGKVVVLELTTSSEGLFSRLVNLHVRIVLPLVGGLLSQPDAYRYLSLSVDSFPHPREFLLEMEEAGLQETRKVHLPLSPAWIFVGTVGDRGASPQIRH